MKKPVRFKFHKGCVAIGRNLPDYLLELGIKNGQKVGVKFGHIKDNEPACYYFAAGPRVCKLQSNDGLLTGLAQFFEVIG